MTEGEAQAYTAHLIDRHKYWSRPMSYEDYRELKMWMRIIRIFPRGSHQYLPGFKDFQLKYSHWIFTHEGTAPHLELVSEVSLELELIPPTYAEIMLISDIALKVAAAVDKTR